ncbi:hypothetical protein [Salinibaculum salinum]|uniref:hypothetical protein n=1 Tax=Salinibaculum salinum TaxID=3131996 RepID=UPI0030EBCDAA
MRVIEFLYDSERASETGERVAEHVRARPESVEIVDLGVGNRADAQREAMLSVGDATRIGTKPDALFDGDGNPDFSDGVVITEDDRGRRELAIGEAALELLDQE